MEITTTNGYRAVDTYDVDTSTSNIDVYDERNNGKYLGYLENRTIEGTYSDENDEVDMELLENAIVDNLC